MLKGFYVIIVIIVIIVISGSAGLGNVTGLEAIDHSRSRPNIIFIFADDLGFGDFGCYGNRKIKTPYLDKMASEGLLFTNFTTSSPVCSPSRVGVMTSHFPAQYHVHYALNDSVVATSNQGSRQGESSIYRIPSAGEL